MRISLASLAGLLAAALCTSSWAASPADESKAAAPAPLGMFDAMKEGKVEVQYIPIDESRQAKLLFKNKTKEPLSLKLPANFGAAPINAQLGGLGGGNNNNNNNNNQNQQAGGGLGGGGGGFGGGGQQGGGLFNIAPEKVGEIVVPTVCLEHGKAEPSKYVTYEVKPLEECTSKPGVAEALALLYEGKTNQKVAQAAVWHLANGLSWEQLAAKKVNRVGRADTPYYEPSELQAAIELTKHVEKLAKANAKKAESRSGE
jgi:hypothetical protein